MFHIRDEEFIRGEAPMTKEEVRAVTIAKLDLNEETVLIDVGAGSGSIGIEASRYLKKGSVLGIECNEKAVDLIKKNINKFAVSNYKLVEGFAPADLPAFSFDRMFIGGSRGNMKNILEYFIRYSKENSKLIINAIALETLTQSLEFLKQYAFEEIEVVSLNVSRNRSVGNLNMMMGENPIYIISAKKGVNNG